MKALNLKLTEQYLRVLSEILRSMQTIVIPDKGSVVSEVTSLMGVASKLYKGMLQSKGLPIPSQREIESQVMTELKQQHSSGEPKKKKQLFDH